MNLAQFTSLRDIETTIVFLGGVLVKAWFQDYAKVLFAEENENSKD